MQPMIGILALLIAATGWYYLFYSKAAERLESIEEQQTNRRRGILRRINAIVMLLMALGIAVGTYKFKAEDESTRSAFFFTWMIVMLLLPLSVTLALIDLRLTIKLREQLRQRNNK